MWMVGFAFVGYAAGFWLAVEAEVGLLVSGPTEQRLLLAAFVAGVVAVVTLVSEFVAGTVEGVLLLLSLPGAVLLAFPVGEALGLDVELSGWWPGLLGLLVIWGAAYQVFRVPRALVNGGLWADELLRLGAALLSFGGLWVVQAVMDGVELPGSTTVQLATLAALAVLMRMASGVALSFHGFHGLLMVVLSVSAALVLTGLKLWALTWLSTPMASPLEIDGFGTFAMATALLTLVTTPVWVLDQAERVQRQEMEEQERHQEMLARQQEAVLSMSLLSARLASREAERWRGRY